LNEEQSAEVCDARMFNICSIAGHQTIPNQNLKFKIN
jgi:hypothetical protein